jgi:predicted CoA-binding protein
MTPTTTMKVGQVGHEEYAMTGRIITEAREVSRIARDAKRVAVLGMKTEQQAGQPAFYVPEYLKFAGIEVIPVPVYYPDVSTILGVPVYRRVADVPGELDVLDVFRRPEDLDAHFDDIAQKRPRVVWLQSGIRNDAFAKRLNALGIDVVQDRCMMVEHRAAR